MAALAGRQQVVDRCAGAAAATGRGIPPDLAVMPAFRMRPEPERGDHRGRVEPRVAKIHPAGTVRASGGASAALANQAASFGTAGRQGSAA